jgi:hypothetical protein
VINFGRTSKNLRGENVAFNSTAYLQMSIKLYIYDHPCDPEVAGDTIRKAICDGVQFTFPYDGEGVQWLEKFMSKMGDFDD